MNVRIGLTLARLLRRLRLKEIELGERKPPAMEALAKSGAKDGDHRP